jgi:hypothetical protein
MSLGTGHPAGTGVACDFERLPRPFAVRTVGPGTRQMPMSVLVFTAFLHHFDRMLSPTVAAAVIEMHPERQSQIVLVMMKTGWW